MQAKAEQIDRLQFSLAAGLTSNYPPWRSTMFTATALDEARSASASSFVPSPLPKIYMLGVRVANASQSEVLDWLFARQSRGIPTCVAYLNAHCSNVAAIDSNYREALSKADLILPDGSGVSISARMHGKRLAATVSFTDFIQLACQRLADFGGSVFLVGGGIGVAEAAAENLVMSCPGLRIAGTHHGFFREDQDGEVIQLINRSGAQMLLVAMGVPRQEFWLNRAMPFLKPCLAFGVGGLFDFLSGRIPRAPIALQAIGMEWSYRLYQEPKRMWKRYLLGNPLFLARSVCAITKTHMLASRRALDTAGKRILDITGAMTALLALSFPMLLVAAAIRMTSAGPAIFRQRRVGKYGELFTMYKFRTMEGDALARFPEVAELNDHGSGSVIFKMAKDPRITPVGRWLRRSSVDELPQLWNVLIGDMSLVGPRPPLPAEVMRYTEGQRRRLHTRPGLTGLSQISGRADLPFERQVELDLYYLQNRNLHLDFRIILKTVPAVISAQGAY
jgi:exopolysaccharide biosynthesis WecB/TagA/CpsF family protein